MKICWTIAGSDSGGGAGIQADLKTFHALGVHGCTVIVGLTAQNTRGVSRIEYPQTAMIEAQFQALTEDLAPHALKTGMLGKTEIIELVSDWLERTHTFTVCDPVMVATSGDRLLEQSAEKAMVERLLPQADLVTPNLAEAAVLCGSEIATPEDVERAATTILALGPKSVLIKGGHGSGAFAQDYWTDGSQRWWLTAPRIDTAHTHGTGCTLSAAIAACVGLGFDLLDALVVAKAFVSQGLRQARKLGSGRGPVHQGGWPQDQGDLPWLTPTYQAGLDRPVFPGTGPEPIGFYPIVDRADWLGRILPLGVKSVQLRIKDLDGQALESEIERAIGLARHFGARLFINDYWRLAMKHGAYGVHLGQEDLGNADLAAIARAGLRLGVSTHCYREVARALAVRPSYIAIGPIYPTTTKTMLWVPQGVDGLARWRRSLRMPLVAIGGISLQRAATVREAGADGIAVITALTQAPDPEAAARQWLKLLADA